MLWTHHLIVTSSMVPVTRLAYQHCVFHPTEKRQGEHLLVSVDNGRQIDLASTNLRLQFRSHPRYRKISIPFAHFASIKHDLETNSGGLAGSMITDCFVGSSVTR